MTTYAEHYRDRISLLLRDLIDANRAAEAANAKVQHEKANIKMMYVNKTEEQTRAKLKVDYVFNDALEDYRTWCAEVQRLSNVIQGIAAAVSLLDR